MNKEMPSIWVLKGNIIESRTKDGEVKSGTRLFRPNAKVYLASVKHWWAVLKADKEESIIVLGQHRKSRKWIVSFVRSTYVENWRVATEANPAVLSRLEDEGWPGQRINYNDELERNSSMAIELFLKNAVRGY